MYHAEVPVMSSGFTLATLEVSRRQVASLPSLGARARRAGAAGLAVAALGMRRRAGATTELGPARMSARQTVRLALFVAALAMTACMPDDPRLAEVRGGAGAGNSGAAGGAGAAALPEGHVVSGYVAGTGDVCHEPQERGAFAPIPGLELAFTLGEPSVVLVELDVNIMPSGNGGAVSTRLSVDGVGDDRFTHTHPVAVGVSMDEDDHQHTARVLELEAGAHVLLGEWGEGVGNVCVLGANPWQLWTRRLGFVAIPARFIGSHREVTLPAVKTEVPTDRRDIEGLDFELRSRESQWVLGQVDLNFVGPSGAFMELGLSLDGTWLGGTQARPITGQEGQVEEEDHLHVTGLARVEGTDRAEPSRLSAWWRASQSGVWAPPGDLAQYVRRASMVALPERLGVVATGRVLTLAAPLWPTRSAPDWGTLEAEGEALRTALELPPGRYVVLNHADLRFGRSAEPGKGAWLAMRLRVNGLADSNGTFAQPSHPWETDHLHLHRIDVVEGGARVDTAVEVVSYGTSSYLDPEYPPTLTTLAIPVDLLPAQ